MKKLLYIFIIFFVLGISSCRSYIPIENKIRLKDSIVLRDSVVLKEKVTQRDSVVTRDSVVLILDESGNEKRKEVYRDREIYKNLQESFNNLQNKYDALKSEKVDSVYVTLPLDKWEKFKINVGGYSVLANILLLRLLLYLIKRKS